MQENHRWRRVLVVAVETRGDRRRVVVFLCVFRLDDGGGRRRR